MICAGMISAPADGGEGRSWVPAAELRNGEQLRGVDGRITVIGTSQVAGVHRVYNLSVDIDHVYRVSSLGTLVHNTYSDAAGDIIPYEVLLNKQKIKELARQAAKQAVDEVGVDNTIHEVIEALRRRIADDKAWQHTGQIPFGG